MSPGLRWEAPNCKVCQGEARVPALESLPVVATKYVLRTSRFSSSSMKSRRLFCVRISCSLTWLNTSETTPIMSGAGNPPGGCRGARNVSATSSGAAQSLHDPAVLREPHGMAHRFFRRLAFGQTQAIRGAGFCFREIWAPVRKQRTFRVGNRLLLECE